jgi:hypothetical protein
MTVLYIGSDRADDPAGLLYYLERVFHDTPRQSVRIVRPAARGVLAWEADQTPALIVLAGETTPENGRVLRKYVRDGGTVLNVLTGPGRAETLAALLDSTPWDVVEAPVDRDVMLGAIAFDHPVFAPLAAAQFNDFTKIHFWKYRKVNMDSLGDARALARFENGDPAVVEKALGKGRLVVLASGWQPADSQLARSSKFVPLMTAWLLEASPRFLAQANYQVLDRVPLPAVENAVRGWVVRRPDGTTETLAPGSTLFTETDQPGVYSLDTAANSGPSPGARPGARPFVVNLDPSESKTAPLHVETLEQFGCKLANPARKLADQEHLRQMHNAELENRQQLWRWLILAVIGVLIMETWLAGRLAEALAT